MNILVTGAAGFVGQHLIKELRDNSHEVVAAVNNEERLPGVTTVYMANLLLKEEVQRIDFRGVDAVIHLAGLAAVAASFEKPLEYISTNSGIEINLFERCIEQDVRPKFVVVSSGSLYDPRVKMPLNESSAQLPTSPYAVSKQAQENLASYYENRGFKSAVARPFNHIGPGQREGFIVPDLTKQIVDVENGLTNNISVGNLEAERDYTDVRDIVRAYRLMAEGDISGTYNICSGNSYSGQTILDKLLALSGVEAEVTQDPKRMRPADIPKIVGDYSKLEEATGWKPEIDLDQTLEDVLEDWRSKV